MEQFEGNQFNECIKYEKSQQNVADEFYKSKWPGCNIFRPDYTAGGRQKELQQSDVDVVITTGSGETIYISEKFRTTHFPDVMLEVYSVWEQQKLGWGYSEVPTIHCHFHQHHSEQFVRIIDTAEINAFVHSHDPKCFEKAFKLKQKHTTDKYGITYRHIISYRGQSTWYGSTITVPVERFKTLKEYNITPFKLY